MIDWVRRHWALYWLLRDDRSRARCKRYLDEVEAAIQRLNAIQRVDEN